MALTLDDEFLNSLPLDSGENFVDLFNSGSLDLQGLFDEGEIEMPSSTVSAPAVAASPTKKNEGEAKEQPQSGPSKEDLSRLDKIENMLLGLEEKINEINSSEENISQEGAIEGFEAVTKKSPMDMFNQQETSSSEGPVVEVIENNSVLNGKEFNKEVLTKLIEQKNTLLQEREKILKSQFNNFQTSNVENTENVFNENKENITNNQTFANESKPPLSQQTLQDLSSQNTFNNFSEDISNKSFETNNQNLQQDFENNQDQRSFNTNEMFNTEGSSAVTNNTFEENNIQNQSDNFFSQPPNENFENIVNNTTNNTTNQNDLTELIGEPIEGGSPEGFFNDKQNQTELPQPGDEMGGSATRIIGLLEALKQSMDGLNEGLGNNFSNLSKSMEGMRNTVINNSYNSSNNQGAQPSPQSSNNNTAARETMPDYRLDNAHPSDFPEGIVDVTRLQGTNLPNPVFIL